MNVVSTVEHYGHNGRILKFENLEGLYPVNRYQSLLLATNVHTETLDYARDVQKPLQALRVAEFCCGGGPVALTLKDAGCGYVEASDINPVMLEMCERNAAINDVPVDSFVIRDVLDADEGRQGSFDIIACNPPCGGFSQVAEVSEPHMRQAINGGEQGIDYIMPLITTIGDWLVPHGRFVFVLTSTMNFHAVVQQLEDTFFGRWRLAYHTPVAQPFIHLSKPRAQSLLREYKEGKIFVWEGEDGYLWRLTWIVVATKGVLETRGVPRRLWFYPYSYEITAPSFWENLPKYAQK
jgi:SAM-dependent methyltransferase